MNWDKKALDYAYKQHNKLQGWASSTGPCWRDVIIAYLAGVRDHTDFVLQELERDE